MAPLTSGYTGPQATEYLQNPDFLTGSFSGWTARPHWGVHAVSTASAVTIQSPYCAQFTGPGTSSLVNNQQIACNTGDTVWATCKCYWGLSNGTALLGISWYSASGSPLPSSSSAPCASAAAWQEAVVSSPAPAGAAYAMVSFTVSGDTKGGVWYCGDFEAGLIPAGVVAVAAGPTGYTGPGWTGYTGYSGYGYTGPAGLGWTGYTGYTGFGWTGYTGYSGYTGPAGLGWTGYTGDTGPAGASAQGPTGPAGSPGSGYTGDTGYTGPGGFTGYTGGSGYTGYTGYSGYTGYTGATGYTGPPGQSYSVQVVIVLTAGPVTPPSVMYAYIFNAYSGPQTINIPAGAAGMQLVIRNASGISSVLTLQLAPGTVADYEGTNGSVAGALASGGGLADAMTLVCDTPGHWYAFPSGGEWSSS